MPYKKIGLALSAILLISHMVPALAAAQPPASNSVLVPTDMMPLPGKLNSVEVLNSNSPEVVQQEGVLVSTLSPEGKATPQAHLNHAFKGRFDIFFHHISKVETDLNATMVKLLYIAVVLHNPGSTPVIVDVLQGASYLSQPDAPFNPLPPSQDNDAGDVYAGPGDRVTNDLLRGKLQPGVVKLVKFEIPAHGDVLLSSLPVPVLGLTPELNGRTYLVKLKSSGPVQAATLASFATASGEPTTQDWFALLHNGPLAGPRETTVPEQSTPTAPIYGRVAGVQVGDQWTAAPQFVHLAPKGKSISYPIASVEHGTFGTEQIQSAPLLARVPGTALAAHGNYGVKYDITLPLHNLSKDNIMALVKLQTPVKSDVKSDALQFVKNPAPRVFYRGTLRVSYVDARGLKHQKYTHLAQHLGEQAVPLVAQYLLPHEKRTVRVEFLYPPDATPPQVLTIESADPDSLLD